MEERIHAEKIILAIAISAILSGAIFFAAMALMLRPTPLSVGSVNLSDIADGEYIGICQNKILFAVVRVVAQDHRIAGIDVLEHKDAYMAQAEEIADRVVAAQSLEVDAVSGATLTSDTVRKAIEDALRKGRNP